MTGKRKAILAVIVAIAVLLVTVGGVLIWNMQSGGDSAYSRQIALGRQQYEAGQYDEALLSYQKAIQLKPDREEGYSGMFWVYSAQGNTVMAASILQVGVAKTGSTQLSSMVQKLVGSSAIAAEDGVVPGVELDARLVKMNTSLLNSLSTTVFDDYRTYNRVSSTVMNRDGSCTVELKDLRGKLIYGKEDVDNTMGRPLGNAIPSQVVLTEISDLFGGLPAASFEDLRAFGAQHLRLKEDGEHGHVVTFLVGKCVVVIAADSDGTVHSGAWNEIVLPEQPEEPQEEENSSQDPQPTPTPAPVIPDCVVMGRVISAVTGEGVSGAQLAFRLEDGSGTPVTARTDSFGQYEATMHPGEYIVEVSCEGYQTESFSRTVTDEEEQDAGTFVISPELAEGQVRIVLEWGESPRDLDSYLDGTLDDGTSVYTAYTNRSCIKNGQTLAELDVDDTNGYGPETTTIYNLNGRFTFYVLDFTQSGTMSSSGATVKIYTPRQSEPTVVNICGGLDNTWYVCEIDHGNVTVLNHG